MGPRSALRNIAAVTIQRWYRRRIEITRAVRLLGILHILHHEAKRTETIAPILFEMSTANINSVDHHIRVYHRDCSDGVNSLHVMDVREKSNFSGEHSPFRLMELLLILAVRYGERLHRLHTENRKQQQEQEQEQEQRRVLLLPDTVLAELLLDVRHTGDAKQKESIQQEKEEKEKPKEEPWRVVWCIRHSLDAACINWIADWTRGVDITNTTVPLYHALLRTFHNTRVSQLLLLFPSASDDNTVLADVPPLPQPPSLRPAHSLVAAETSDGHSLNRNNNSNNNNNNNNNNNHNNSDSDSEEEEEEGDEEEDEDYDNDKYYNRQHAREEARLSRILSVLQMERPSEKEKEKNSKNEAERRSEEEAAAQDSYIQLFGEVKEVLFPTLNAMKMSNSAGLHTNMNSRNNNNNNLDSHLCIVCELAGVGDELVMCCCGNHIHRECTDVDINGVLRCSRFCHPL